MTYQELLEELQTISPEQLGQTVSFHSLGEDGDAIHTVHTLAVAVEDDGDTLALTGEEI